MKPILLLTPLMLLMACTSPEQREANRIAQEQADIAECTQLGFKQGSEAFADCRLRLKEMRALNRASIHPHVGVGFGCGRFGRW